MSSYRSRLLAALGLAPWLVAFPIYQLAIQIQKEVSFPRFLGLLNVAVLGLLLVAMVVALVRTGPRVARAARFVIFTGVIMNLAAIGLAVYYNNVALAPAPTRAIVALAALGLAVAFARKAPEDQALSLRVLRIAGLSVAAALGLSVPYVLVAASHDQPRNPESPTPPEHVTARRDAPRRIVLVTFDELRRQSTSLARPESDTTPNLVAIAAQSTRYTNCHSAGDQTIVSMPTVLTGMRPPSVYGYFHNDMAALRQGSLSGVAGFLKAAGYRTGYSTMLVDPRTFGMRDEYDDGWSVAKIVDHPFNGRAFLPVSEVVQQITPRRFKHLRTSSMPADVHPIYSVVEQALALYNEPVDHSFLWVHLGLPHHPYYRIPKSDLQKIIKPHHYPRVHPFLNGHQNDPAFYESVYEDYTRFSDAMLGKLIAGLQASPEWRDTLLIITSDHGTHLHPEQGEPYAVGVATEDITHVPLLVHAPGQKGTARVASAVRHEDIVPTILSQVYPTPPAGFKGDSLLGASLPADRIGYTWAVRTPAPGSRRTLVAYQGPLKLMLEYPARTTRLVNWQRDPDGRHDLSAAYPEMTQRLNGWLARELGNSPQYTLPH